MVEVTIPIIIPHYTHQNRQYICISISYNIRTMLTSPKFPRSTSLATRGSLNPTSKRLSE